MTIVRASLAARMTRYGRLLAPRSRQHYEDVAFADRLALLAADLLHGPVVLDLDRDLHLHRLQDDDRVAIGNRVADGDFDFPHVPSYVSLDVRHVPGQYPSCPT